MKKILIITSELPPQPGGIGTHAHQLAKHLSISYEVKVLADQRSGAGDEEKQFDSQQAYQIKRIERKKIIFITYLNRIRVALSLIKHFDVVLVSGKFPLWLTGLIKRKHKQIPLIGIIHGTEVLLANKYLRKLTDQSLMKLDAVIGVSNYTLKLVDYLKLKSTFVIPNGIEVSLDSQNARQIKKNEQINFITVGNLTQRKGQHNFIKALPSLIKHHPNLKYHIVGIPTNKNQIQKLAKELKVENYIQIYGRVSEEEKNKLLEKAHIFVMLSERTATGDVEGFGIAVLEANNKALPAIGSKDSGIEDAIKKEYSGELVNPYDQNEIRTAVNKILEDYPNYSKQALSWSKDFNWKKIVEQYKQVIEKTIPIK